MWGREKGSKRGREELLALFSFVFWAFFFSFFMQPPPPSPPLSTPPLLFLDTCLATSWNSVKGVVWGWDVFVWTNSSQHKGVVRLHGGDTFWLCSKCLRGIPFSLISCLLQKPPVLYVLLYTQKKYTKLPLLFHHSSCFGFLHTPLPPPPHLTTLAHLQQLHHH